MRRMRMRGTRKQPIQWWNIKQFDTDYVVWIMFPIKVALSMSSPTSVPTSFPKRNDESYGSETRIDFQWFSTCTFVINRTIYNLLLLQPSAREHALYFVFLRQNFLLTSIDLAPCWSSSRPKDGQQSARRQSCGQGWGVDATQAFAQTTAAWRCFRRIPHESFWFILHRYFFLGVLYDYNPLK